jgi:hypothetical protein
MQEEKLLAQTQENNIAMLMKRILVTIISHLSLETLYQ